MPIYTVEGPDGRIYEVEGPEGASNAQVIAAVRRQIAAQPAAPKESTIFGEIARGGKQLLSTSRTGIGALASPEEAARAGVERSQQIAAEAGEGPSFAALRKVYEERGLLPAAGELVSQIPRAVAGQLPQLAALAGGAKLGAMAGTAVLPGPGTIAGGVLGAGATLLPQFFGANVERQAAEQMERGEQVKIDRGAAAAAAAGQAGIEAAGTALVLGKRVVKGILGVTDDAALATAKAREELVKAAGRSRLGAAGRGAAVGLAEIPVEIAQAVIERAQAGLDVMSPEAFTEYGENAYLAGLVGPTIGAATRVTEPGAARRKLAVEEQAKAAEERAAAAKAEAEQKKTPEYLLDLETRYKEADAERVRREAEVAQRPKKGADPAQWIEYNQKVAELKEFKKANTPLNNEYTARKADIDAVNQQRAAEAEATTAQEIPQEAQKLPYYASAQETIPGLEPVEAAPETAEETVDYAKQARDLKEYLVDLQTQAKTTTDLDAKLKLSTDYARAEAALKEATRLTKASGQEEGKAIDKLRKQMAVAEDQGDLEAQGRIAQQLKSLGVTDLGAQAELDLGKPQALKKLQVPTDMADYQAAQQRAAEEKAAREAQQRQQQQLAREAYERSQQTAGMYTDVLAAAQRRAADRAAAEAETKAETERTQREEELVGKLVESTGAVQPQPVPQARMALPTGETTESLYDQAAELRAQLTFAQQTRNKNLESRVRQQLQQIGASPEEKGSALDLGATAREAGVEGELTPEAMEQNRLTRLGQRQLMSYDQLVKFITQTREREQTAVDEKTKAQYKYRAEQLKQAAIGFALQEINGRRQQYGLAPLEQKEALRAVTGLARPLNELVARGAQIFEEPVVVRGQQRGIRLVEGAQEFERPPAGKRTFSEAGFPAAADTLREQFRQVVETVSGKPQAAPPSPYAKPAGAPRRVVPEQRELFLTPPPAEEPVSLAPEGFFAKGIDKAASADDARLLRQMQEVYTTLTPQQQSVVREQAQRAADGKPLDAVYEMRGLYQLRQREAATAAGQQTFLKPITLVTARRKIEQLAQKAATLEKDLREKLEALLRTGVTRGIPELDTQLKAAKLQAAAKAPAKTTAEQAQAALDRALKQGKPVVDAAQQVKTEQFQQIAKFSSNIYTPLLERQKQLNAEWDAAVGEFSDIQLQYDFYRAEFDAGRAPKTNRAELEALTRLIPGTADRVVEVSKRLDAVNQMVTAAENVIARVREKQAADTVVGPLLKEAAKAEAKIKTAQQKLAVAKEVERSAERAHKKALENVPKEPTLLSQIEALPITGAVRVFRDTSDPAVQSQATKKRSAIAREEGTYAVLEERIKDAQGDERVKLQKQLNESEERLQKLHDELYDVYSNAPLKRVEGKTVEAAASAERLEKARHEVHSAEIDSFNAKHDTARLSLPARKAGPIISEKGVVKQGGERVIKAEPATPIADIAATRKRIDEINQQFAYIKENPAKSAEGKAKQAKVKTQLAAERQTLGAKLKELLQAQRQVSQEEKAVERELKGARTVSKRAIKQTKLEATDAQLFEDLADAKLSKEQRQLFERAQNAFGEMSAPEQAFVRRQANALVGRREADYKAEALTEVVQTAERRIAREGDIEFSRGTTESPSTTASVRTELSKAFPDLGRVQIYDSIDALVAANPQYEGRIPSDARGFVDTAGNKAFLIAENINKGDALAVLLHEVGAHIGLKNMLGTAQYNALVKAVETWAKKNDGSVESRVAKTALERVEAAKTPANQKADETLAYAIEEAVKAGVKPMETKGALGQWLSQIATLFRKALEKFGLPPKSLDAQGLVDMAFGAAKLEMTGAKPSTSKGDLLFTYAGERSGIAAEALKEAKEMTAQGAPMEEVWNKTGWFQSADKKWRFEIDDSKAKFRFDDYYDALKDGTLNADGQAELKLGNILWHPSLYKSYPALKDLPVKLYDNPNDRVLGSFGKDEIKLNLASPDSEGVLLHEIQHYIQGQEGFRSGSNTTDEYMRTYKKNVLQSVRESYARMAETSDTSSERTYYRERVVAMDAGIAAAEKARSESAKTIADARKEWQKDKKEIAEAMDNLRSEYELLRSKHAAALDAYSDAKLKFIKIAKSKTATTAEKDAAWSEVQKADKALLATPKPDLGERLAEHDKLIDKQSAAHKKYIGVTYAIRKVIDNALDTAIKAKLPSQSVFAAFARLGISEQAYQNVLGEVEARDVEERRTLSAEERAATRPYSSQPQRREEVLFSRNLPTASRVADSLIAKEKGWVTKLKDNFLGMGFRTQFVDKLAPSEEALKRGGTDPTKALQAMYYLRMYDQRMHFTSQSITEGVPELVEKTRRDGTTERLIETKAGANIQQIVDILKGKAVVKAAGSPDAANKLFTLYLAAIRGERVGYDKLNFKVSEADIKAARAEIEADPTLKKAFDEARDIYNQYNRNLLEFSVQTGALSREEAKRLLAENDYIPYYRMRDGVAEMVIGGETPIRIGNLKDSPHLKELVGGDEAIFDFLTSSVQNTSMLLDMATKNLATKNLMFELRDVGLATVAKVPKSGKTPEGAVTFKRDGEDHYAVVDTDTIGIDSDLLVKGLAGIPTMFPAFVRVLGVPARLLRRVVVASPVYMARQLFRDSLAAALTSGADITPVLGSLKQIGKPNALQSRGITGGQVFTGMPEDVTRMLKDMQAGKISVTNGLSYLEAKAAQVDALTRKAQYESYLKQGLSEMEATYMALESMNFSKRGLSPTMHMVSTLIPFFNAQIQGLDVLYKSFTGQMPLNERLAIREKLWTRGLMLAGLSMAYALAMQDDETYKNAKPEEKYGNWFVQVPGFEQMVRLPIPFELGYIFKALPEALVNTLSTDQGGEDAMKAFKHIAQQMVPGASSYFLPQAVKPALETLIGTSLYTGRSIESTQEQMMEPGYRYRDNTTEAAKFVGELTGFSPVKMEFLIRGYTGSMGMALLGALSAPFGGEGPEAATKRASDMPVVGTLFQPKDASGIIDATYDRMKQVNQVKETYEGLLNKGRQADAEKYLKENIDEMALASVAGSFKQYMGQITEYERQIRASNMTPEKKREALDQARKAKIQLATSVRAAADKKAPQAAPA